MSIIANGTSLERVRIMHRGQHLTGLSQNGKVEQRNLPHGFTELDYASAPANSVYSNSELTILPTYKVELVFETGTLGTSTIGNIFGGRRNGASAGNGIRITKLTNNGVAMYGFDSTDAYESGANVLSNNTRYTFLYQNGVITLTDRSGTVVDTHTYTPDDTDGTPHWAINGYYAASVAANVYETKFVSLRIWDNNGALIAYYRAAKRDSDNAVGMCDSVTNALITPASGTWTAGPAATPTPEHSMDLWCNNGKLRYGVLGKNLFDVSTCVSGYYINASGVATEDRYSKYSALIPVSPNTNYMLSGVAGGVVGNKRVHAYNASGEWIAQLDYAGSVQQRTSYSVSVTTTATTAYLRISVLADDTNIQVELGSSATSYEPYVSGVYTDGTPEVLTCSGCGKNLLSSTPIKVGYYIDASGVERAATTDPEMYLIRQASVKPSTQYTLSYTGNSTSYTQRWHAYDKDGNWLSQITYNIPSSIGERVTYAFITPSNCYYVRQGGRTQEDYQLELGSPATSYVPYRGYTYTVTVPDLLEADTCEDTLVGKWTGKKNLFDPTKVQFGYYRDRNTGVKNTSVYNFMSSDDDYIPCLPNTAYTFVGRKKTDGTYSKYNTIYFFDSAKNYLGASPYETFQPTTGTTPNNCYYLQIRSNPLDTSSVSVQDAFTQFDWQLEQGSTSTTYEPYRNWWWTMTKTANIGIKVLTGDNTKDGQWGTSAGASNLYSLTIADSSTDNAFLPISSHFVGVLGSTGYAAIQDGQFKHGSSSNIYFFKDTSSEDVTAFKARLAAQYTAGTPVIIIYPRVTPTIETDSTQFLPNAPSVEASIPVTVTSTEELVTIPFTVKEVVYNGTKVFGE